MAKKEKKGMAAGTMYLAGLGVFEKDILDKKVLNEFGTQVQVRDLLKQYFESGSERFFGKVMKRGAQGTTSIASGLVLTDEDNKVLDKIKEDAKTYNKFQTMRTWKDYGAKDSPVGIGSTIIMALTIVLTSPISALLNLAPAWGKGRLSGLGANDNTYVEGIQADWFAVFRAIKRLTSFFSGFSLAVKVGFSKWRRGREDRLDAQAERRHEEAVVVRQGARSNRELGSFEKLKRIDTKMKVFKGIMENPNHVTIHRAVVDNMMEFLKGKKGFGHYEKDIDSICNDMDNNTKLTDSKKYLVDCWEGLKVTSSKYQEDYTPQAKSQSAFSSQSGASKPKQRGLWSKMFGNR